METEPLTPLVVDTPGTALVRRHQPAQTGLGITDLFARVSGLGLGAAGMAVRVSVEAVERFVPTAPSEPGTPTIAGPMGELLHTVPGLVLGAAYLTRGTFLAFSAGIERGVTSALSAVGTPGLMARPVSRVTESAEGINRWAYGEQEYNEMLVAEFVRRFAPAVAESLVTSIDMPNVVSQLPIDAMVAEIDFNAIVAQIDIGPIASQVIDEIDIPGIIAATTTSVATELIDANRVVFMHVDDVTAKVADRVLRPRKPRQVALVGYDPAAIEERPGYDLDAAAQRTGKRAAIVPIDAIRSDYARERQGVRAGFWSRMAGAAFDLLAIIMITFLFGVIAGFLKFLFTAEAFELPKLAWSASVSFTGGLALAYYAGSWATTGRTIGEAVMGLRVVTESGRRVRLGRAVVRALAVIAVGAPCTLWCIVSKKNAALYDLPLKTTVVYDWTIN